MRKAGITVKIWLSIGVFVLGFVLSTVLGQVQSLITEHTLRSASESLFPAAQLGQEAESAFQSAVKGFGDAVVVQDASGLDRASQDGDSAVKNLQTAAAISGLKAERRAELNTMAESVRQFIQEAHETYGAVLKNPVSMTPETQDKMQKLAGRTDSLKASLEQNKERLSADLHSQLSASQSASATGRWFALLVFVATICVAGVIVNATIQRSIVGPINRVIRGVQEAATDASQASDEMAHSGQVVAQEAQRQAAYLEETSAALEEISTTTRQNASRAEEANKLMQNAAETAVRATRAMNDLTSSMDAISQSSKQVSGVLRNIDEIAFLTNILALNAAVEAARAGEAGAGFSVVADEVRSLARRAADAARRSSDIVEKTIKDVAAGVHLLSAAQKTVNEIASAIVENGTVVAQIAASSQEQARGVTHIGQAIVRIGEVTQNNVANATRSAQAASAMRGQMQQTGHHLEELVEVVGFREAA